MRIHLASSVCGCARHLTVGPKGQYRSRRPNPQGKEGSVSRPKQRTDQTWQRAIACADHWLLELVPQGWHHVDFDEPGGRRASPAATKCAVARLRDESEPSCTALHIWVSEKTVGSIACGVSANLRIRLQGSTDLTGPTRPPLRAAKRPDSCHVDSRRTRCVSLGVPRGHRKATRKCLAVSVPRGMWTSRL